MSNPNNLWTSPEHALAYLARADNIPRRVEGEMTAADMLTSLLSRDTKPERD